MQAGYRLRAAREGDLAALASIERRAATLFEGRGLPMDVLAETTSPTVLADALGRDGLWVAVDEDDAPVGFALLDERSDSMHLAELDVDPAHGRRGIGASLVEWASRRAGERGHHRLTLTTYADVPWNAPYYERLGFRVLARGEWSPALHRSVEEEARQGLDPSRRVVMQRDVAPHRRALRWAASAWLLLISVLSIMASQRPSLVLQFSGHLPGRDKTGHFLLMGGFAFLAMLAFAGARVGSRRISPFAVLTVVFAVVIAEEWMQRWAPRRTFSLEDLAYSLSGVLCFGALAFVWQRWPGWRRTPRPPPPPQVPQR